MITTHPIGLSAAGFFTSLAAIVLTLGAMASLTVVRRLRSTSTSRATGHSAPPITAASIAQVCGAYLGAIMLSLEAGRYYWDWTEENTERYCLVIMASMVFLHHRACLSNDHRSIFMRIIAAIIFLMLPFSIAVGYFSYGLINYQAAAGGSTVGFCLSVYPLPLSVALLFGNTVLSTLLIYKFVSVLLLRVREWRQVAGDEPEGTESKMTYFASMAKATATRNLIFSTAALLFSDATMVALISMDVMTARNPDAGLLLSAVDLLGSIDVFVNVMAIFSCSMSWVPRELRTLKSMLGGPAVTSTSQASRHTSEASGFHGSKASPMEKRSVVIATD
ncbi:hypothetical protein HK405_010793, partial [Cladochytrium tenue]